MSTSRDSLGTCSPALPADWLQRYRIRPVLIESACESADYRAANWIPVGRTRGRGKLEFRNEYDLPVKYILLTTHRAGTPSSCISPPFHGSSERLLDKGFAAKRILATKAATAPGLPSLQSIADLGVPHPMPLYERFLGRPDANDRDSVSGPVAYVVEVANKNMLSEVKISYRATTRAADARL